MKKLPDYREKQRILYIDKKPDNDLIAYGESYLELGMLSDAIEFYQRCNYHPGLEKLKNIAAESGDVMFFYQAIKALKQSASVEEWNMIGQRAFDLKKYTFALQAFENSINTHMIEKCRQLMMPEVQ